MFYVPPDALSEGLTLQGLRPDALYDVVSVTLSHVPAFDFNGGCDVYHRYASLSYPPPPPPPSSSL